MLPKFVKKIWGWELWFANVSEKSLDYKNINYCGKLIYVEYNKWSSNFKFHYHIVKDETFFILEGHLQLDYIDDNDMIHTIFLNPHDTFRVKPLMKHRFTSVSETGCKFVEVSTFHSDSDSYRCERDVITGEWKE